MEMKRFKHMNTICHSPKYTSNTLPHFLHFQLCVLRILIPLWWFLAVLIFLYFFTLISSFISVALHILDLFSILSSIFLPFPLIFLFNFFIQQLLKFTQLLHLLFHLSYSYSWLIKCQFSKIVRKNLSFFVFSHHFLII